LNGIWQATTTANWDLLAHTMRPAVAQPGVYPDVPVLAAPVLALGSVGGVPPGPGVVEGNAIPYNLEAAAKKKDNAEHWLDRDPEVRCYMPGIPRAMYMPISVQITQGTNKIEMSFEFCRSQPHHSPSTRRSAAGRHPGWAIRSVIGKATRWSST